MGFCDHTIDPMSGRQYSDASERTVSGTRCGVASSRGYATEADHDERDRAYECAARFKAAMCKRSETCGCGGCTTARSMRAAQLVTVAPWSLTARVFLGLFVVVALGVLWAFATWAVTK